MTPNQFAYSHAVSAAGWTLLVRAFGRDNAGRMVRAWMRAQAPPRFACGVRVKGRG